MSYHRLLVAADALASADARFLIAEGLPALAAALARLPRGGRVLLREGPATDAMLAAAGALPGLGLAYRGAPLGSVTPAAAAAASAAAAAAPAARRRRLAAAAGVLAGWRSAPWAAPWPRPPYLGWAHRLAALTSDAPLLAALPLAGAHALSAATPAEFAAAAAGLAAAAAALHGAPGASGAPPPPPGACTLAFFGDGAFAGLSAAGAGALPRGWALQAAGGGGGRGGQSDVALAHASLLRASAAALVDAAAPPLYLGLLPRGALLLWLLPEPGTPGGGALAAADIERSPLCALGVARCAVVARGGGLAREVAAELSRTPCSRGGVQLL